MQTAQSHTNAITPSHGYNAGTENHEENHLLLAGLLEEILNSALLTTTTASIANWLVAKKDTASRRNLISYFPPSPAFFQQSLLKLCVHVDTFSLSSHLREYYDRLEFLRTLTFRFADVQPGSGIDDPISIEVLSGAWQELAGACRAAVLELGKQLSDHDAVRNNERYIKVLSLLTEIERGNHPCVGADGMVTVPFWAERRALQRRQLNLHAYIVVNESIERVAVLDASEKGIGILGLTSIPVGTTVHLLVRPGFSIAGKVVWVNETRAGISLEQPLPADSSLFALGN